MEEKRKNQSKIIRRKFGKKWLKQLMSIPFWGCLDFKKKEGQKHFLSCDPEKKAKNM
jgi:hypothetical protein